MKRHGWVSELQLLAVAAGSIISFGATVVLLLPALPAIIPGFFTTKLMQFGAELLERRQRERLTDLLERERKRTYAN